MCKCIRKKEVWVVTYLNFLFVDRDAILFLQPLLEIVDLIN